MSDATKKQLALKAKKRWAAKKKAAAQGQGGNETTQGGGITPPTIRPIDAVLTMTAEQLSEELNLAKAAQAGAGQRVELLQALYRARAQEKTLQVGQ